ncbi:hypothetical protein U6G28_08865 [Actinomycetaceae bacterium MB13-C1-2]|nr:hypothetical protein U6G28_08865 [Actinomycetaceae bacterium MB13-C1-2]
MSAIKGQIVAASWENGHRKVECDLEDCPCPTHEESPLPPGTYVTVRLPENTPIGLWNVYITRQEEEANR